MLTGSIACGVVIRAVCILFLCQSQPPSREVRFGLNSFLGNLDHSELRPPTVKTTAQDRTAYLDMVRALGVTSIRETFMNWAEIEPTRGGGYNYSPFDDFARKAADRDLEVIALFYPFPPWATGKAVGKIERDYVALGGSRSGSSKRAFAAS